MIGRTVGRFHVVAPLGRGGMASVWRAHDELLGREIALKVLAESLAQSPDSRRRFRHEARIASQLDHPGIAAVYDSGENDGVTWIAMVLIDGESLADRLARSLPPPAEVVCVALAVADALGHAHSQGVVHRDVTARNVMLGRDGRIFVLDFGLALAQESSRISSSGTLVGTAPYMAPEVLQGATADPRSDLYSLGVLLYEALTGAPPFVSASPAAMAFATLHQPVPAPRSLRPELSAELEAVVLRCMDRDPGARFANTAALAAALRACPEAARASGPAPAPVASIATVARSASAERLASGTGPVYLAAPRFAFPDAVAGDAADVALADAVSAAARSGLSQLRRLHVVPCDTPAPEPNQDARREYVRAAGANLLLAGTLRRVGTRLRVAYELLDPEAGLQISGDAVEGTTFDPFDLEERLAANLRRALGGDASATRSRAPDPAAPERFRQAQRYLERHDHEASVDGAIAILERLIESEGESGEFHAAIARAFIFKHALTRERQWPPRATAACERARRLAPDAPDTLLALGDLHHSTGNDEEALRCFERVLETDADRFEAHLGRARALEARGRNLEAAEACERAIGLRPEDWRGHNLRGLLHWNQGDFGGAAHRWERVLQLVPDTATGARNLGSAFYHLDRFEEAVAAYRRSLEIQPNAIAFTNLGTALFFLRQYDAAAEAFEKSVALMPADPVKWGNLGTAYCLIPGRGDRGREALERAIGLMRERLDREAGTGETWSRLAGWYSTLDHRKEAADAIRRALEQAAGDANVQVRAAKVALRSGRLEEVLSHLEKAIRFGYGLGELRRDPELESVQNIDAFRRLLALGSASPEGTRSSPQINKENFE